MTGNFVADKIYYHVDMAMCMWNVAGMDHYYINDLADNRVVFISKIHIFFRQYNDTI